MIEVEEIVEDLDRIPRVGDWDYAPTLNEIIIKILNESKTIFCRNENIFNKFKLDIPNLICSYDESNLTVYDLLLFEKDYVLRKPIKETAMVYWVELN